MVMVVASPDDVSDGRRLRRVRVDAGVPSRLFLRVEATGGDFVALALVKSDFYPPAAGVAAKSSLIDSVLSIVRATTTRKLLAVIRQRHSSGSTFLDQLR